MSWFGKLFASVGIFVVSFFGGHTGTVNDLDVPAPAVPNTQSSESNKPQDSSVKITFTSPTVGAELYEGSTTTISYQIANPPSDTASVSYNLALSINGDSYEVWPKGKLQGGSFNWYIPNQLFETLGLHDSATVLIEAKLTKTETIDYSDSERTALAQKYHLDIKQVPTQHTEYSLVTDVKRSVKIYQTSDDLIGAGDYYPQEGVATLGSGNTLDVWGGRFLIRLVSLQNNTAHFTTLFDPNTNKGYTTTGAFDVSLGKEAAFNLPGTDTFTTGNTTYQYTGHIALTKTTGPNLGVFTIAMDTEIPQTLTSAPPANANPTTQTQVNVQSSITIPPLPGTIGATVGQDIKINDTNGALHLQISKIDAQYIYFKVTGFDSKVRTGQSSITLGGRASVVIGKNRILYIDTKPDDITSSSATLTLSFGQAIID